MCVCFWLPFPCVALLLYMTMHWRGGVRKDSYIPTNFKCCDCPLLWALKQIKLVPGMLWMRSDVAWGDTGMLTWSVFCPSLEQQVLEIIFKAICKPITVILIASPSGLLMWTHTDIKYYLIWFFILLSCPASSWKKCICSLVSISLSCKIQSSPSH